MTGQATEYPAFTPQVSRLDVIQDPLGTAFEPLEWQSSEGLKLAGRDYGAKNGADLPILCLAGLTRNSRDFEPLAAHLVAMGRRIITVDYRGRGLSDRDPQPDRYSPLVELADTLALIDGLGLQSVQAIGTSRGGILLMLGALIRPQLFERAILNDVGPKIDLQGLLRIKSYVGRDLGDMTWEQAQFALSVSQGAGFPTLDGAGWQRYARRLWRDVGGKPVSDYDPALALGLASLTPETKLPELWEGFDALAQKPVLVLRGGLSDILTDRILNEMTERQPSIACHVIPDEAHAPLLEDDETLGVIERFLNGNRGDGTRAD